MKVFANGSFDRDIDKIRNKELQHALDDKILQLEKAKDVSQVTGLKLLKGYTHHFRIKIETTKHKYRIGVIIRGNKIWLIRFLPRKSVYRKFP